MGTLWTRRGLRQAAALGAVAAACALPARAEAAETLERCREKCMHIDDERYMALISKMRENPDYEMFHDVLDYMTVHRVRLEQENEI